MLLNIDYNDVDIDLDVLRNVGTKNLARNGLLMGANKMWIELCVRKFQPKVCLCSVRSVYSFD